MQKFLNFFKEKVEYIENQDITFWNILFAVYFASFLRAFFEAFSNPVTKNLITGIFDSFFISLCGLPVFF